MTGKVIGTYQIVQALGHGLHATTYQAVEQARGQLVALKAIQPVLAQQAEFKQRLRALAATLTPLRHPHLAAFHTILQMGSELYLVGEFVDGTPLTQSLQGAGVLPCEQAVRVAAQALEALAYAHEAGLWHGGVKPSNLILAADGQVKLTDLGLAQAAGGGLLQAGLGASVLNYAAPEQLRGGVCDARTDVYAMGAVLYEMLTGLPPFRRANDAALRQAHLAETPPSPRNYFPLIPQSLENAVLRALNKAPEARFASAREFRRVLLEWADAGVSVATPVVANPAVPVSAAASISSNKAVPLAPLATREIAAMPTPLTPNDWPQLAPSAPAAAVPVAASPLHDEVLVDLEETPKRGFWKPIAAVTGVAALLGATYAVVRVNEGAPVAGPGQVVIKVSPTLPPPAVSEPTPAEIPVQPLPVETAQPIAVASPRPKPAALAPKTPTANAVKPAAKPAPPKPAAKPVVVKTKPTPTPSPANKKAATLIYSGKELPAPAATKKKAAPTPTPAKNAPGVQKKGGGVGGFFKGIFGGGDKGKKAAPTPTPKPKHKKP